jgi:hypothetical protein
MHMFYMCGNILSRLFAQPRGICCQRFLRMRYWPPFELKLASMCRQQGQRLDGSVPPARPAVPTVLPGAHSFI